MAKKKEKENNLLVPIKLDSLDDMARLSYNFNFTSDSIFASRSGNGAVIYSIGEKLDGLLLVYSLDIRDPMRFLLYKAPENSEPEKAKLSQTIDEGWQPINILSMRIESLGFAKASVKKRFKFMELGSFEDLVKLAIHSSSDDENTLACLYCFADGRNSTVYGIDLIDRLHDGNCTVYYAVTETGMKKGFAIYDYKSGKAAFTDRVGEHSYMYLKIINLA